jgi:hypothetical protein
MVHNFAEMKRNQLGLRCQCELGEQTGEIPKCKNNDSAKQSLPSPSNLTFEFHQKRSVKKGAGKRKTMHSFSVHSYKN